jgi:hypothetical protein
MDEVIFTGRMPEIKFEEERSLELAELSDEEYKNLLVSPLPRWIKFIYYIIGYLFLFIGLVLLALILIGSFG